jgi:hypothetical protein
MVGHIKSEYIIHHVVRICNAKFFVVVFFALTYTICTARRLENRAVDGPAAIAE